MTVLADSDAAVLAGSMSVTATISGQTVTVKLLIKGLEASSASFDIPEPPMAPPAA